MKNVPSPKVALHPRKGTVKSPMEISNVHGKQDPFQKANFAAKIERAEDNSPEERAETPAQEKAEGEGGK